MAMHRYEVHNYALENTLVFDGPAHAGANMIGLVVKGYITSEHTQDLCDAMNVGDEQIADDGTHYIRRIK